MKNKIKFTEGHMIKLIYNILLSVAFLHEANVMHRDLKPANILINDRCDAKICDFGFSRTVPQQNMGYKGFNTLNIRENFFCKHG